VRVVVPRLGEKRAILLGLFVGSLVFALYGSVPQGWMIYPVMLLALFGWTIAQPATMGMMSRIVPANEQGLLQGAIASMNSLTAIAGPPIWTGVFAYFVSPSAPAIIPGAAFDGAAGVFLAAFVLAARILVSTTRGSHRNRSLTFRSPVAHKVRPRFGFVHENPSHRSTDPSTRLGKP
jgi:DHA1 family tetracycline resistance protein-like MFS transporter